MALSASEQQRRLYWDAIEMEDHETADEIKAASTEKPQPVALTKDIFGNEWGPGNELTIIVNAANTVRRMFEGMPAERREWLKSRFAEEVLIDEIHVSETPVNGD